MGLLGRSEETKGKHELELEKELALRRSGKHPKDLYNKGMHLQGPDGKPALGPDRKPVKLAMDGLPLMEFLVPDKTSATGKVPWDPKKHDRGDPKTDVHLPEPTPRVALVPHPTDPSKPPTKIVCKPMVLAEDGLPLNVLTAGAWVPRQGADGKPLKKLVVPKGSGGGDHHEVRSRWTRAATTRCGRGHHNARRLPRVCHERSRGGRLGALAKVGGGQVLV